MDSDYFSRIICKDGKITNVISQVYPELPYNFLMKLLRKKDVKINGKSVNQEYSVSKGDRISLYLKPSAVPLDIVFENEFIFCLNKSKSLVCDGQYSLCSLAEYVFPDSRMLHRLDTNTSGLVLFAKNVQAYEFLLSKMKEGRIEKTYLATVYGEVNYKRASIEGFLLKDSDKGRVKIFDNQVKGSVFVSIIVDTISIQDGLTKLQITLHKGKTHQIRAQLAHIGCFIIGDGKYGDDRINKMYGYRSQELKAVALKFNFSNDIFGLGGLEIKL